MGRIAILHVTAPSRAGGLERVVASLAVGQARAGHVVHVAAVVETQSEADQFLGPLAAAGVHTHAIVLPGRAYRRERAAVRALCREIMPSVMHTHGYRADVATSGVARQLGIATATTVHGFTGGGWRNRLYEALQVRAFRRFDAVVAVSKPLAEQLRLRGVPARRLRLVVNAFSASGDPLAREAARARLGLPLTPFCIGWVGRLSNEKGPDVLLEATPHLSPDTIVSFIGDGRERAALETRAAALGVESRVRWHGLVSEAGLLLRAFDAYVLSSRTEGTPIALFEAMAAGVPVIATRVGGVPDVVGSREALLIPEESPAALAEAVRLTRNDPAGARARAAAAKARLEHEYDAAPWLAAYEAVYREIARSPMTTSERLN